MTSLETTIIHSSKYKNSPSPWQKAYEGTRERYCPILPSKSTLHHIKHVGGLFLVPIYQYEGGSDTLSNVVIYREGDFELAWIGNPPRCDWELYLTKIMGVFEVEEIWDMTMKLSEALNKGEYFGYRSIMDPVLDAMKEFLSSKRQ